MTPVSESGPQHLGTLWILNLDEPSLVGPLARVAVTFQRVGPEATPSLTQAMGFDDPAEVLQRFAAGKRCYTGSVEGVLATYGWVTFDEELIGELGLRVRLMPGEAYIWDCATLPAYRGLRLYPALLWYIINDLRAEGLRRIWIGADADNIPSQTGMVLCGFKPVVDIVLDRALAMRMSWVRGSHGAPEQLVEDARRKLLGGRYEAWLAALSMSSSRTTTVSSKTTDEADAPPKGDASVPTPLHTTPAPTRQAP
jgi:GNAT superfamily N-acetyltransferase